LASLPEAHKLPFLQEWVLKRFGIRYDAKYNEKRWKYNHDQRARMEFAGIVPKVPVPSMKEAIGYDKVYVRLDDELRMKPKVSGIQILRLSN
ncbi:MAG: DUF4771 domain-containing protein, partial [Sumerlaeia bacterium]